MSSEREDSSALPAAVAVQVKRESLVVDLSDGRSMSVPLEWFPRLLEASDEERRDWQLVGSGESIRWPRLDEDLCVEALLGGKRRNAK